MRLPFWICALSVVSAGWICSVTAAVPARPAPRMSYLDNGEVRIGMDLALGGAVTFLSSREHPGNLINSADLGRQIQMSHYSGPWPYSVAGKNPEPHWAGLGWNPIQTGDCQHHPSEVLEHRNDGQEVYVRCRPMQWPLENVPADCVFETWTRLEGPVVHMRFRCTNERTDTTPYRPTAQELPAVYTISTLHRLMAYTGDQPFTGAPLTHVTNDWRRPWPWTRFFGTERWAALVNDDGWGLGVFKDDGAEFHGGIHGEGKSADPLHGSTAYVAPIHTENFDHNIVYEHRTTLMLGRLDDLRSRFNAMATRTPPRWEFGADRQHWTFTGATDLGLPLRGEWRLRCGAEPFRLASGLRPWRAEEAAILEMEVAATGSLHGVQVGWKRLDGTTLVDAPAVKVSLIPDGRHRTIRVRLAESPDYRGLLLGLVVQPLDGFRPGDEFSLRKAAFESPAARRSASTP